MVPDSSAVRTGLGEERARLLAVRASLSEEVAEENDSAAAELSTLDQHQAELGTDVVDREQDLALLEQVSAQLEAVDAALARLEDGTYGRCEVCGDRIGDERLEALPTTRLCLQDAQLRGNGRGRSAPDHSELGGGPQPL